MRGADMPMWSVRVDADTDTDYDEALDSALRGHLAAYSPAIGAAYAAGGRVPRRISVQLSDEAPNLRKAVDAAVKAVANALRAQGMSCDIARVEGMSEEEFGVELSTAPPELMGVREIASLLEVSRQRADMLTKRPDFPQALAALASGSIWPGAAVRRWASTWERKTGRPAFA